MRKRMRRIACLGALGLALVVVVPGSAHAVGVQTVQAGFQPKFTKPNDAGDWAVPPFRIPPRVSETGSKYSKKGTLYTRLFLRNYADPVPEAAIFQIHSPEELTYTTKRLDECDPSAILNRSVQSAKQICSKALIGSGNSVAYLGGPVLPGSVALFNGTKSNGFPTVLFHSTAGTPVTLISEMQDSPLPGYGTNFVTRVAQSAGGGVPDGIPIVDTDFTISKKFTDKKLKRKSKKLKRKSKKLKRKSKKAKKQGNKKKAKKLKKKSKKKKKKSKKKKKKSKKSWVTGKCTDGELVTRIDVGYVDGPPQTDAVRQACS